jgi:hypothetical protein
VRVDAAGVGVADPARLNSDSHLQAGRGGQRALGELKFSGSGDLDCLVRSGG